MKYTDAQVRVGVGVLVIRSGKILIGKRQGKNGFGTWSPPGGHLDVGETPQETAVRETYEETGLRVANPRFVGYTNDIFTETPGKHYVTLWIAVNWNGGEAAITDTHEMSDFLWTTFDALPEPCFLPLQHFMESSFFNTTLFGE